MFTRNSSGEPKPRALGFGNGAAACSVPPSPRPSQSEANPQPQIGNDLKVIGQGLKIFGPGRGAEAIGETGKVSGRVTAERVIVPGTVSGVIRGAVVALKSSSRVAGDVRHVSSAIVQGAKLDGRCRRAADASQLTADLPS